MKETILLIVILLFSACYVIASDKDKFIGEWEAKSYGIIFSMRFQENGVCIPSKNGKEAPPTQHGSWKLLDSNKIRIITGKNEEAVGYINKNNELVVTPSKNAEENFRFHKKTP